MHECLDDAIFDMTTTIIIIIIPLFALETASDA